MMVAAPQMTTSAGVNPSIDLGGGNSKGRSLMAQNSYSLLPAKERDSEGQYSPKVARAGGKGGKAGRIQSSP